MQKSYRDYLKEYRDQGIPFKIAQKKASQSFKEQQEKNDDAPASTKFLTFAKIVEELKKANPDTPDRLINKNASILLQTQALESNKKGAVIDFKLPTEDFDVNIDFLFLEKEIKSHWYKGTLSSLKHILEKHIKPQQYKIINTEKKVMHHVLIYIMIGNRRIPSDNSFLRITQQNLEG